MTCGKSYKVLRLKAKEYYKNIGILDCPAFPYEKIHFQNAGFKHLIYKEKRFRPIPDQIRRFKALLYIKEVLNDIRLYSEYRKEDNGITVAHFWSFEKKFSGVLITIIIRKINNGALHFFSVRQEAIKQKPPEGGLAKLAVSFKPSRPS